MYATAPATAAKTTACKNVAMTWSVTGDGVGGANFRPSGHSR